MVRANMTPACAWYKWQDFNLFWTFDLCLFCIVVCALLTYGCLLKGESCEYLKIKNVKFLARIDQIQKCLCGISQYSVGFSSAAALYYNWLSGGAQRRSPNIQIPFWFTYYVRGSAAHKSGRLPKVGTKRSGRSGWDEAVGTKRSGRSGRGKALIVGSPNFVVVVLFETCGTSRSDLN